MHLFKTIDDANKHDGYTKFTLKVSALNIETILEEEKCTDLLSSTKKFLLKKQCESIFSCLTQLTIESVEKAVAYLDLLLNRKKCNENFLFCK